MTARAAVVAKRALRGRSVTAVLTVLQSQPQAAHLSSKWGLHSVGAEGKTYCGLCYHLWAVIEKAFALTPIRS